MAINGVRAVQKAREMDDFCMVMCKWEKVRPRSMGAAKRISAHKVRRALARELRREIADAEGPE